MARRRRRRRRRWTGHWQRTRRSLDERVRRVGPDKFGILAVDCSKKRFAVRLTDFYGRELMGLLEVENTAPGMKSLIDRVKAEEEKHGLKDLVVGLERTGRYHVPICNALKPHWGVLMVHPLATKQLRQPVAPGNKTDATDLEAIMRAIMVGYGTRDRELPDRLAGWRLLSREREELVHKRARVRVRLQEQIEAIMPGYTALFADLWSSSAALALVRHYGSAQALLADGPDGIVVRLHQAKHLARKDTVAKVLQWAREASAPDPQREVRHRTVCDQFELMHVIGSQILAYERDLADVLVDTPFVVLLRIPGINVASAAGYGAELGPIEHYPTHAKITGRAGLYPSRYQSDETDRADGPLVGHRNARLRDAIMEIAHNLLSHNEYFKAWGDVRRKRRWPRKKTHVAVATKFVRMSYWMLADRTVLDHPSMNGHTAVLRKLERFARDHGLAPEAVGELLVRASKQLPPQTFQEEALALKERLPRRRKPRSTGARGGPPMRIGDVLRKVIDHLAPDLCTEAERSQPSQSDTVGTPH